MKKLVTYLIAIAMIFGCRFLPPIAGMSASAMQVLGVFFGTLILWLTTAIDWPSYLCILGLTFVPELTMNSILASSFGNTTVLFLLFTFMCTYALSKTSFVRRCAIMFISNPLAQKGPWWFVTSYCLSVLIIGMFISPVVLFVVYLPIMETICEELKLEKGEKLGESLMLGQLFSCCFACGMTPIAHVFPVMSLGFYKTATGIEIGYLSYMGFAVPVGLVCFIIMMLLFRFVLRPDMNKFKNLDLSGLKASLKPVQKREKLILAIFILVIFLWVAPEFIKTILPGFAKFLSAKGTTFPPLLGAVLLYVLSVDGEPLLTFKDTMTKGIQWGSIIMAAATLAVGSAMTNADIGITSWMTERLGPVISNLPTAIIILAFVTWAIVMTNICSNVVTCTVVCAVAIPLTLSMNGSISTAAIASIIGLCASYAYCLPPAHPNVAVAIGSGWTSTNHIAMYGAILAVAAILVCTYIGYPIAAGLMSTIL